MSSFNLTHSLTRAEAIALRNRLNRFLKPKPKPPPKPKLKPKDPSAFGSRFMVAVSYFDAMRARHQIKDLNYFRRCKVDIIRIYLNFSYPPNQPWNFLFKSDGSLDAGRLGQLKRLLALAERRDLIIDISSSRRLDGVDGKPNSFQMTPQAYARCWINLAKRLNSWGYKNPVLDFENEHNCGWAGQKATMSQEQARSLAKSIKNILPDAFITASVACHISPEAAAAMAKAEGMNILAYHDPRDKNCVKNSESLARRCKKAFPKGLSYFQEPCQIGWGGFVKTADDLMTMAQGAKKAGIASWCFHNNVYDLSGGSFESKLVLEERKFMNRIKEL